MRDQVEEVKNKTDIVTIIGERIQLTKAGKNFKANCPFHSEKTPSFIVSPEIAHYKCFGCGETGDVFTFLEKFEGMEFFESLKYLAERAGVKLVLSSNNQKGIKETLYEINNLVSKFYSYVLLTHPDGKRPLKYLLEERGLKTTTIETFKLGYSPDQPLALKGYVLEKKKVTTANLEKTGVVYKKDNSMVDRFKGRIVFPLYDHRGNICGFAGRILPWIEKALPPGRAFGKYINTPETAIYLKSNLLYGLNLSKAEIKKSGYAVIVEGELDMISSWQTGVKNVVAIKGSALTPSQVKLLSRYAKKIVLALDSDFAGNSAARRGIEIADKEGLEIKVARLGKYKDPDDAARSDPEFYKKAIKEAVSIWDFLIETIFSKHEELEGIDKAQISKEIVPILLSIEDRIVQAHYIEVVAKRLKIPQEAVYDQVKSKIVKPTSSSSEVELEKKGDRPELLEERLLSLMISYNPLLFLEKSYADYIKHPLNVRLYKSLLDYLKENTEFEMAKFSTSLPTELVDGFNNLVFKGSEIADDSPEVYVKEIEIVMREIELLRIRADIKKLTQEMSKKGLSDEQLDSLNKEFNNLTKRLSELEENNHKGIILLNQ